MEWDSSSRALLLTLCIMAISVHRRRAEQFLDGRIAVIDDFFFIHVDT